MEERKVGYIGEGFERGKRRQNDVIIISKVFIRSIWWIVNVQLNKNKGQY